MDDFRERIAAGEFENKLEYPTRIKEPRLVRNPTSAQAMDYAKALRLWEFMNADLETRRKAYHAEDARLYAKFRNELLADLSLTDHPKADKVFGLAYERGHSEGLQAVYYEAELLADLVL